MPITTLIMPITTLIMPITTLITLLITLLITPMFYCNVYLSLSNVLSREDASLAAVGRVIPGLQTLASTTFPTLHYLAGYGNGNCNLTGHCNLTTSAAILLQFLLCCPTTDCKLTPSTAMHLLLLPLLCDSNPLKPAQTGCHSSDLLYWHYLITVSGIYPNQITIFYNLLLNGI